MPNFSLLFPIPIAIVLLGCSPNDPRLAEELYKDALELSNQGKILESKALMEEIAKRWPEKLQGITANQDIFRLNAILNKAEEEKLRQTKQVIRATCDALARYYIRNGEYPPSFTAPSPAHSPNRARAGGTGASIHITLPASARTCPLGAKGQPQTYCT